MNYLNTSEALKLYEQAMHAAHKAYVPFSEFPVGAVVLTNSGDLFTGANVENASYGLTICAERTALGNAVSAGHKDILAIAIYAQVVSAPPCGACRQFIIEFGENILVIFKHNDALVQIPIMELLPYAFTKNMLQP